LVISQNDPLAWLTHGVRPLEAVLLVLLTTSLLTIVGIEKWRAAATSIGIELFSLLFSLLGAPVHIVLYGWLVGVQAVFVTDIPAEVRLTSWSGRCGIDVHGSMWVGSTQPVPGRFVKLEHCCGFRDDGTVWCDGRQETGAVASSGGATIVIDSTRPMKRPVPELGTGPWKALSPPCGVSQSGDLECTSHRMPDVPAEGWRDVDFAGGLGCGLRDDGRPVCWGPVGCWGAFPDGRFEEIRVSAHEACARAGKRWECWGHPDLTPIPKGARDVRLRPARLWLDEAGGRHEDERRDHRWCSGPNVVRGL
jgi:hypothetical protein